MLELFGQSSSAFTHPDEQRFRQFLFSQIAFVLVSPVFLRLLDVFSFDTYFVTTFLWFLIMSEVLAPEGPDADWWRIVQWTKLLGLLVFFYVVAQHVMSVLQ